ncbi:Uncharacterised protein [Cedecea neteri]|uniref:Uncharacterized protein n=1 Tax=Cedecea neteri TaxID=158822 RepID=A0A291DVM9_9ENTR|nr:hypothetical protein [Cedecea neteri]ATF91857.1 hypothetical protein CO704_07030 [Cedecea neteri]SQC91247.1 Uncharacterised protein [Cedecea neteri]
MPEITQKEMCYPIRQKRFELWSKRQPIKQKYAEYFPPDNSDSCFGISLSWGMYFLEHLAKDKSSLPIYKNTRAFEKFIINGEIAQRDYASIINTYGNVNGQEIITKFLNEKEKKNQENALLHPSLSVDRWKNGNGRSKLNVKK